MISEKLHAFNSLFSETAGLYHQLNVSLGLSDSVSDILYALCFHDGSCPIRELCWETGLPKQTVNSALRHLEQDGLLFLEMYSGRKKRAVLTKQGRQFCEETIARIFQAEEHAFAAFSSAELETFLRLHEKYNAALKMSIEETVGGSNRGR